MARRLLHHSSFSPTTLHRHFFTPSTISLSFRRHFSYRAEIVDLIDAISLSLSPETAAQEASAKSKMDEMIRLMVIRKSTPDWLPFVPGSSFWVPPRRRSTVEIVIDGHLTAETSNGRSYSPLYLPEDNSSSDEMNVVEVKFVEAEAEAENTSTPEEDDKE